MALVSIPMVPQRLVSSVPISMQAAAPFRGDVTGLLVTPISHLFFPQGDAGREGEEGVPGEVGRRVNGTVVPVEGGGRHGADSGSLRRSHRGAAVCWGLRIPEGGGDAGGGLGLLAGWNSS